MRTTKKSVLYLLKKTEVKSTLKRAKSYGVLIDGHIT